MFRNFSRIHNLPIYSFNIYLISLYGFSIRVRILSEKSKVLKTYISVVKLQKFNFYISDSIHAQSLAASKVEQALSEVASSLSSFVPKPGPQRAWLLQLQVWLLLAEVFLDLDHPKEATSCIQEASNIFPLSHHIMYSVSSTLFLIHKFENEN